MMVLGMLGILCLSLSIVHANSTISHDITITSIDDTYVIDEKIIVQQDNDTISFKVQSSATDVSVIINNSDITLTRIDDNEYRFNYSEGLNNDETFMTLSYSSPKKDLMMTFEKEFTYDTNAFTITYDGQLISSGEDMGAESRISIQLPEDQDARTSLNLYTTILIVLLIVLVIVSTVYGFKKRKNGVNRNRNVESTELLSTEKSLLMNLLKEIERKHRDQKISDETYQKLKSHYKQQTVEIMSNLED